MIIYKITNLVNGKIYVGQTQYSFALRWKYHLQSVKNGSSLAIHCAIRKYGEKAFVVEQVDFASSLKELNEKEAHHIIQLNSLAPNGYNLTTGGDKCEFSRETRQKISESLTGRPSPRSCKITHCKRGHLLEGDNVYFIPSNNGRVCKTCRKMRNKGISRKSRIKIYCKRGHFLIDENVYTYLGKRQCKICMSMRNRGELPRQNSYGKRSACKRGHPLTDDNVYYYPNGSRQCRICRSMYVRYVVVR